MIHRLAVALVALSTACAGPGLLVVGETVEPPEPPLVVRVLDARGAVVAGATVRLHGEERVTDDQGTALFPWPGGPVTVQAAAPGFQEAAIEVATHSLAPLEVALQPTVLSGVVRAADGGPLAEARVMLGEARAVTGADGSFRLERVVPGELRAERPGWLPATEAWDGEADGLEVTLQPRVVRALYATGPAAADPAHWARLLELAERTDVNGMVIDLKDTSGTVYYLTEVLPAVEAGAVAPLLEPAVLLADLEERGLYPVARIVAFEDPRVAVARPDLAVWDAGRQAPWRNDAGRAWLDPTDRGAQDYLIALAEEACRLGFREVQFDYVRFPTDGPLARARFDGGYQEEVRVATISGFLERARHRLHALGCAVAADIFGFMTSAQDDGRIGQRFEAVAAAADVISPMIYPSHYAPGWFGFEEPNDHPRQVAAAALDDALARLPGPVVIRPWLQAFSFGGGLSYGPAQVRAQIEEAERRGLGWMLWNAGSRFSESALAP